LFKKHIDHEDVEAVCHKVHKMRDIGAYQTGVEQGEDCLCEEAIQG